MHKIKLEYPDDVLGTLDEEQIKALAREGFYARLYEQGAITSSRAAQLLGISRWDFLDLLGRYGVSYFDDNVDFDEESRRAQP